MTQTALDIAALVRDPKTKVIVTCGSGGVGKTFDRESFEAAVVSLLR